MTGCSTCLAADNADPANLQALVRWQAVQLEGCRDEAFALKVARLRITELEETVDRLNAKIIGRNHK